jgi:hypothetical protein
MRISSKGKDASYFLLRDINNSNAFSTRHIGQVGRPTIRANCRGQARDEEHKHQHTRKAIARKTKRNTHFQPFTKGL